MAHAVVGHERQPVDGFAPALEPGEFCFDGHRWHFRTPDGAIFSAAAVRSKNGVTLLHRQLWAGVLGDGRPAVVPNDWTLREGLWTRTTARA